MTGHKSAVSEIVGDILGMFRHKIDQKQLTRASCKSGCMIDDTWVGFSECTARVSLKATR